MRTATTEVRLKPAQVRLKLTPDTTCALALILLVSTVGAVEPGLPSKTAVWAAAARAVGAKNPNPELRNPDDLAVKFLGPRERALLPDYPMDALDLGYDAAMQQLGDKLPVKSHAFRTKAFPTKTFCSEPLLR